METYAERLQAAGSAGRPTKALDNFDDNALAWFTPFVQSKPGSPLYERGMRMVGDGSQQKRCVRDGRRAGQGVRGRRTGRSVAAGSWLVAPAALSEHANYAPPNGEHLTAQLLAALADNPAVWAKTVFILNYDEHGGFFDQHAPPVPPLATGRGKSTVSPDGEVVCSGVSCGRRRYRSVNQAASIG